MRTDTLIPTLLLAMASLGGASPVDIAVDRYIWTVADWVTQMSSKDPTIGEYTFTIFGPYDGAHPNVGTGSSFVPAFTQLCQGTATGSPLNSEYKDCVAQGSAAEKSKFAARVHSVGKEVRIGLRYTYESLDYSGGAPRMYNIFSYNVTKDWSAGRRPENFIIDPRNFCGREPCQE